MKPQLSFGPWSGGVTMPLVVFLMTAAFMLLFGPGGSATSTLHGDTPASAADIYRQSVHGVVKIEALGSEPGQPAVVPGTAGTGFVVDGDGTILTNAHIVTVGGRAVATVKVTCTRRAALSVACVDGVVLGVDDSMDVAVVKVDPRGLELRPLPLGDSTSLEVGDPVFAIGNPLDYDFSMRSGIVSALHRVLLGPNNAVIPGGIQTDAAVNEGDSGGPLIDGAGRVIGINEQIATAEGGAWGASASPSRCRSKPPSTSSTSCARRAR